MSHQECYLKLIESLVWLKENKDSREIAIVITELEKLIAYYKVYGLINASSN